LQPKGMEKVAADAGHS